MAFAPELEQRHPPGGAGWSEQHRLVVAAPSGSHEPLVLALGFAIHASLGRCAFHAAVLERGRHPIAISDSDIPVPAAGWELRASGLWADHICETPFEHWSYGLEAFALALDDGAELLGRGFGERTPLGWELEFEASSPAVAADDGADGYRQAGIGHGLLLFAGREVEIEGQAVRSHRWGSPAAAAGPVDRLDDGAAVEAEVALPTPDHVWWFARTGGGGACSRHSTAIDQR